MCSWPANAGFLDLRHYENNMELLTAINYWSEVYADERATEEQHHENMQELLFDDLMDGLDDFQAG